MELQLLKGLNPQFKSNYCRLIAHGYVEATALAYLEVEWMDFFELLSKDPEFRSSIEEARKARADRWVDRIAVSIDKVYETETEIDGKQVVMERPPTKDELGRDKLQFEKMKFLAQADNPEKYSAGAKPKLTVEFDMSDFKLLSVEDAQKVLTSDPFANVVDAEFTKEGSDGK